MTRNNLLNWVVIYKYIYIYIRFYPQDEIKRFYQTRSVLTENPLNQRSFTTSFSGFSLLKTVPNVCSYVPNSPVGVAGSGILSRLSTLVLGKEEEMWISFL